jgi:hypothetical protein
MDVSWTAAVARGFRRLQSLMSAITLVCGRIPVALPT